jgi:Xaa-Pro aminopeptidase
LECSDRGAVLTARDHTVLEAGMVITLEPGIETGDRMMMVHEENIVIREGGAQILSPWASGAMPIL